MDIVVDVRIGEVVQQRAIVDSIPGKQGAGVGLPETNTAGRVAWQMQYFESDVPQVNDVALVEQSRGGRRGSAESQWVEARFREGVNQTLGHLVARLLEIRPQSQWPMMTAQ